MADYQVAPHTGRPSGSPLRQRVALAWRAWLPALGWGYGVALAHRLLLGVWMALVWLVVGVRLVPILPQHLVDSQVLLDRPVAYALLGVWRRWDANHYLSLAADGYTPANPGPSVFSPLAPLGFRLFDWLLPGPLEVGALVFGTATFGLALALLYRVCEVYYGDASLGQQAVVLTALLPLSFFFDAPMSEAIYLALVLGLFYAGARGQWWLAAVCGLLATLARTQGAALAGLAALLLLESQPHAMPWPQRGLDAFRRGWVLVLIPLGYPLFVWYRASRGLPSLSETYASYSYVFFVDPLTGLFTNLRYFATHLPAMLIEIDYLALFGAIVLAIVALWLPRHRRLPLLVYSWGYLLLFVSKLNWEYGTDTVLRSGSIGRYGLALFPLTVLAADLLRQAPPRAAFAVKSVLAAGLLVVSAQHVLFIGPP